MSSVKRALSIKLPENPKTLTLSELINQKTILAYRPECETDFSSLQLIPYITLVDTTQPELKFFVYTRGQASGEQRLQGKCSVGLGGHIEEAYQLKDYNNVLINSVATTAVKELEEEVGLSLSFGMFANAMSPNYCPVNDHDKRRLLFKAATLLYNDTTPTDCVHLGISFIVKADSSDIKSLELDIITRGRWMTLKEILVAQTYEKTIELEVWSKSVLGMIHKDY